MAVIERKDLNRFELTFDGGVAIATYRAAGERLFVNHTEVPEAFSGRGLASQLAKGLFEIARATDRKIVPACSFIADWASRHPEYADVTVA